MHACDCACECTRVRANAFSSLQTVVSPLCWVTQTSVCFMDVQWKCRPRLKPGAKLCWEFRDSAGFSGFQFITFFLLFSGQMKLKNVIHQIQNETFFLIFSNTDCSTESHSKGSILKMGYDLSGLQLPHKEEALRQTSACLCCGPLLWFWSCLRLLLQWGCGGGHPDASFCSDAVKRDSVLDRLADPFHPRLQQTPRRQNQRDPGWDLLSNGHPGSGVIPTALQWVECFIFLLYVLGPKCFYHH